MKPELLDVLRFSGLDLRSQLLYDVVSSLENAFFLFPKGGRACEGKRLLKEEMPRGFRVSSS